MSANKTPQIHTQGNSKYLPKHVCFAGTVSERERAPRSSAQGQHKRSVPCAHQVLVPPRLPPLPASRIPLGVYTRQVPRPDAQSMAAPPPPPSPRPPLPRRHCLHRHHPPHRRPIATRYHHPLTTSTISPSPSIPVSPLLPSLLSLPPPPPKE